MTSFIRCFLYTALDPLIRPRDSAWLELGPGEVYDETLRIYSDLY